MYRYYIDVSSSTIAYLCKNSSRMDDDDSSIQLVYDENLTPQRIKDESETDEAQEEEEEECVLIAENADDECADNDKDPMDLLELLEKRSPEENSESKKSETNESEHEDESESVASAEQDNQKMRNLREKHIWCFENPESRTSWCLYCNIFTKWCSASQLVKHESTVTHGERAQAYRDFLDQLDKDKNYYYSNENFDGDINDVKEQRQSLDEDFMNYLWDKWEEEHEWLVRTNERFIAYCKYCHMKINVGISHTRNTHEDGTKHKEYKNKAPKRRATICGDLQSFQTVTPDPDVQEDNGTQNDPDFNSVYYEKSKSSSDLCRCKLCDITMFLKSFSRHTASNLHRQNLNAVDCPGVSDKLEKPDWVTIQKDHEWLIEDPTNSMEAFCKYCQKRIGYGASAVKRLIHEHSATHRSAVQSFLKASENDNPSESSGGKENENTEDNNENEQKPNIKGHENSEGENSNESEENKPKSSRKRRRNRSKIKEQYPWAKKYKKDPRFYICQYCKVLLTKDHFGGKKHEATIRHQQSEKLYLDKVEAKSIKKNTSAEPIKLNENVYPWLVKFKNGIDYVFCKYCNSRFSRRASRVSHQNTKRHMEAAKAFLEKEEKNINNSSPRTESEKDLAPTAKEIENKNVETPQAAKSDTWERKSPIATQAQLRKMKARITEWQKRFTWLRFEKNLLLNYGFCSYCDKSVYMPTPGLAIKHQKSGPHKRAQREFKKLKGTENNSKSAIHEDAASEKSSAVSDEPPAKRFRASSLKTAIETAKRLTAAHLEMISFMQNNGQNKTDLSKTKPVESQTVKTMPPPPPSPSLDSNAAMPLSRDPFDLFFNSTSETLKRLPADLASEGKLKVMQIIFELEIRALQRQNQTEVMNTSSHNTSLNGSVLNTTNGNTLKDLLGIHSDTTPVTESLINPQPQPPPSPQKQKQHHRQYQQHQPQQQHQQIQTQSHQHKRQKNDMQNTASLNSILQQQLSQPSQPPPQRNFSVQNQSNSSSQHGRNISSPQLQTNSSPHRNMTYKTTSNLGINQVQRETSQQHLQSTQRKPITNMGINNITQRLSVNNTSMSFSAKSTAELQPSSTSASNRIYSTNNLGSYQNNARTNNGNTTPNKMPLIRPVPLSSLTLKKYSDIDEPAIHHIQLNSSTQSKIIPLDNTKITHR